MDVLPIFPSFGRPAAFFSLTLLLLLPSSVGHGQSTCFGAGSSAQQIVSLQSTFTLSERCEYGLSPNGPFARQPAGETDFLQAYERLARAHPQPGDPRAIFGRARRGDRTPTSVVLRFCSHYLLEEQLGFRASTQSAAGDLRIRRTGNECGAQGVELWAVEGAQSGRLRSGRAAQVLEAGASELALAAGDWSLFAARPGSSVGLRVGVFRSQRVVTALANYLRQASERTEPMPLVRAQWPEDAGGMLLSPVSTTETEDLLWPELRTAAEAGFAFFAGSDARQVLAPVQLEAGGQGHIRLPDSLVNGFMREHYGDAGARLAPSLHDVHSVLEKVSLCSIASYRDPVRATMGQAVPAGAACARVSQIAAVAQQAAEIQASSGGSESPICIARGSMQMRSDGARYESGERSCVALPESASAALAPAIEGDRLDLSLSGVCVSVDGEPLVPNDEGVYTLRAGLVEVRRGGGEQCGGPQALSLVRIPVFDPEHQWHPVGLFSGGDPESLRCGEGEAYCPFSALAHDEADVFAYAEPRHELEFRISSSPAVAAVMNESASGPLLSRDLPTLAGVVGDFEGPAPSALTVWASRDATCPSDRSFAELRAESPLDVDDLQVDQRFTVHLLSSQGETVSCLARASFRVRASRAVVAETVAEQLGLELGLLGDMHLAFFASDPVALGLALPLAYFRFTPGVRFIGVEVALNGVAAGAFDPAALSRLGLGLSFTVNLGIPEILPRLLAVGGMLHLAAETHPADNPIISFYVGLNMASLIDLAGGR